jgi:MFS family permease
MATGLITIAIAMLALAVATAAASIAGLAASVAVAGLGLSWAALTSTSAATRALPTERQGIASGAVNTAAQIGTALGVATLLTVAGLVGSNGQRTGYIVAFLSAAAAAGSYASLLLLRTPSDHAKYHRHPKNCPRRARGISSPSSQSDRARQSCAR